MPTAVANPQASDRCAEITTERMRAAWSAALEATRPTLTRRLVDELEAQCDPQIGDDYDHAETERCADEIVEIANDLLDDMHWGRYGWGPVDDGRSHVIRASDQ